MYTYNYMCIQYICVYIYIYMCIYIYIYIVLFVCLHLDREVFTVLEVPRATCGPNNDIQKIKLMITLTHTYINPTY